jgi:succinate-semialdehyde dehydrogenase / glutarate-semialdehyde dehydrogenase
VITFSAADANMLIDGKWVESSTGKRDEIRNPATGVQIATVPAGDERDVERAIAAAQRGRRRICATPSHERCAILMRRKPSKTIRTNSAIS